MIYYDIMHINSKCDVHRFKMAKIYHRFLAIKYKHLLNQSL